MSKLIVCLLAFLGGPASVMGANTGKHKGHPTPTASPSPTPAPTATPIPIVTLAWNASTSTNISGYHLWMGFASGGETQETDVGNVLVWTVQLSPQTTYYFVVTAYNSGGDSARSNEVSYRTP